MLIAKPFTAEEPSDELRISVMSSHSHLGTLDAYYDEWWETLAPPVEMIKGHFDDHRAGLKFAREYWSFLSEGHRDEVYEIGRLALHSDVTLICQCEGAYPHREIIAAYAKLLIPELKLRTVV